MSTYIIGDIQGCFTELQILLTKIHFDPVKDRLGFTGDLVNRGPESLATLRFIKNLDNPIVVLGNHDLYLLAIGYNAVYYSGHHTLSEILDAPDKIELLDWLRQQPLIYYDPTYHYVMTHAGIPPQWNLNEALNYAEEIANILRGKDYYAFLTHLLGNHPSTWSNDLKGWDRLRYITNAFTRMRFCQADGTLEFNNKTKVSHDITQWRPWFDFYKLPTKILFGHWASLEGECNNPHCEALDTGCLWGNALTAYRVEDGQYFSIDCSLISQKD